MGPLSLQNQRPGLSKLGLNETGYHFQDMLILYNTRLVNTDYLVVRDQIEWLGPTVITMLRLATAHPYSGFTD